MGPISEKIERAKNLDESLRRTEKFLKLLLDSQIATGGNKKTGKLNDLGSIEIAASICTGSNNIKYKELVYGDSILTNIIAKAMIPICRERVISIKEELKTIINL